jgi:hypothetical protein
MVKNILLEEVYLLFSFACIRKGQYFFQWTPDASSSPTGASMLEASTTSEYPQPKQ